MADRTCVIAVIIEMINIQNRNVHILRTVHMRFLHFQEMTLTENENMGLCEAKV